jgi:hypothetical protein
MANPTFVTCKKNVWKRVAQNVTAGQIWKADKEPNLYIHTYRTTGQPAPTDRLEGMPIFQGRINEQISAAAGIDVYVMATESNGKVRVDI